LGKVVSQSELIQERAGWKRNGKCVVFASGWFDLLHPGHIRFLEQARSLGDILVVAIRNDPSVSRGAGTAISDSAGDTSSKGPLRPITPAAERAEIVAALAAVDFAFEMDESASRNLIAELLPDILVQGGAAGTDEAARREELEAKAAEVKIVRIPLEPGHSTSRLIERIQHARQLRE
jgi:rfaE bifunctional protein nucleotidyltransferase chain/domain